jgi:AbrB family looped-hinge helix DNA binding protein
MTTTVTLSSKNQIVVPQEAREKLHIGPGHQMLVLVKEDRVVLIPRPTDFVERMSGLHRSVWSEQGAEAYLRGERDSWER